MAITGRFASTHLEVRAKKKEKEKNGEWAYGELYYLSIGENELRPWVLQHPSDEFITKSWEEMSAYRTVKVPTYLVEVEDETVCVKTSFIDAFKNPIYENDYILAPNQDAIRKVCYKATHPVYTCVEPYYEKERGLGDYLSLSDVYIVGNYIDTPVKDFDPKQKEEKEDDCL